MNHSFGRKARTCSVGFAALSVLLGAKVALATCPTPAWNQIVVYGDANRGGPCQVLGVGSYNAPFGGVQNDWMSSIELGVGVSATLYQNGGFSGNSYTYSNGPFVYNLAGWANDDVSSLTVSYRYNPALGPLPLSATIPGDSEANFDFSTTDTASATNSNTRSFDLGTHEAGQTIRLGTCSAGGDLPAGIASGDTFLRVFFNGNEWTSDDDGCGSVASHLTFTVPFRGNVTIQAGCWSANSCSGHLQVKWSEPDSNGSVADVPLAFAEMTGNAPRRNKLNFSQASMVLGAYTNNHNDKHFQGMVRVPRTLASNNDNFPRFVLAGSDNADLYTVQFAADPAAASLGLVGSLPNTPSILSRVVGQSGNGGKYLHNGAPSSWLPAVWNSHLGGLQASGRWLAGGIEAGGEAGPSTLRFWDISHLPNPVLVSELDDTTSSASGIALTKMPGKNQPFVMLVGGLNSGHTAELWTMDGSFGYANLMTGTWQKRGTVDVNDGTTGDDGFQALNFVSQDNRDLSQDNGDLYLVGMVGAGKTGTESGADTAILYKVNHAADWSSCSLQKIASTVYVCDFDGSRNCAFNAASNLFVDANLSKLRVYGSKGYRPDDSNASMTFVEYY